MSPSRQSWHETSHQRNMNVSWCGWSFPTTWLCNGGVVVWCSVWVCVCVCVCVCGRKEGRGGRVEECGKASVRGKRGSVYLSVLVGHDSYFDLRSAERPGPPHGQQWHRTPRSLYLQWKVQAGCFKKHLPKHFSTLHLKAQVDSGRWQKSHGPFCALHDASESPPWSMTRLLLFHGMCF